MVLPVPDGPAKLNASASPVGWRSPSPHRLKMRSCWVTCASAVSSARRVAGGRITWSNVRRGTIDSTARRPLVPKRRVNGIGATRPPYRQSRAAGNRRARVDPHLGHELVGEHLGHGGLGCRLGRGVQRGPPLVVALLVAEAITYSPVGLALVLASASGTIFSTPRRRRCGGCSPTPPRANPSPHAADHSLPRSSTNTNGELRSDVRFDCAGCKM